MNEFNLIGGLKTANQSTFHVTIQKEAHWDNICFKINNMRENNLIFKVSWAEHSVSKT